MNLSGRTIVLGVTGGIAAYKAAQVASKLKQSGADVHVIMTEHATQFVSPLTFETLTNNRVSVDTFDRNFQWNVQHVSLAKRADLFLVAPATANVLAKMAYGLADDMLTTTILACSCPKMAAPAMNTGMYHNPITQRNLQLLQEAGVQILRPDSGYLACGDVGDGRLPEPEEICQAVEAALTEKDLAGLHILVTAGPTQEPVDPVRYLTNHSTGKMGFALAKRAALRGAQVTLVAGPVHLPTPWGVERVDVTTAQEMYEQVTDRFPQTDITIKAAAVADFRPAQVAEEKIKKSGEGHTALLLERTRDILAALGQCKGPKQVLCGFSMETEHLLENSQRKRQAKGADLMVANSLRQAGAGFGTDTNLVTILSDQGQEELPLLTKEEVADRLLDRCAACWRDKQGQ